jgi:peptide deformylase
MTKPKSFKIAEVLVQKSETCSEYLTRPLFPVNMRLYKSLKSYRKIVQTAFLHMNNLMELGKFEDYPRLAGISGANIGVPWNIIIVPSKADRLLEMINPSISRMSRRTTTLKSNCGSLVLPKKVDVKRRVWVEVSYYDLEGAHHENKFTMDDGYAGTIQHEIDHNRGVLITDFSRHL